MTRIAIGFGNKVSITVTQTTGIIVGALSFTGNPYDGHTLPAVLAQHERLTPATLQEKLQQTEATEEGYR